MYWAGRGDCRECDLQYSELNRETSLLTEDEEDTDFPNDDMTDDELVAIIESCENHSDEESVNEEVPTTSEEESIKGDIPDESSSPSPDHSPNPPMRNPPCGIHGCRGIPQGSTPPEPFMGFGLAEGLFQHLIDIGMKVSDENRTVVEPGTFPNLNIEIPSVEDKEDW